MGAVGLHASAPRRRRTEPRGTSGGAEGFPFDALLPLCSRDASRAARGQAIAVAGCAHPSIYIVKRGWCIEERISESGRRFIANFFVPGDVIGLERLFHDGAAGDIVAFTCAEAARVPLSRVVDATDADAELASAILSHYHRAQWLQAERLVALATGSARARTAYTLAELYLRLRQRGLAEEGSCAFPVSQGALSDAVALSAVHLNRTIQSFRADRLLELGDNRLTIRDLPNLMEVAGSAALPILLGRNGHGGDSPAPWAKPEARAAVDPR